MTWRYPDVKDLEASEWIEGGIYLVDRNYRVFAGPYKSSLEANAMRLLIREANPYSEKAHELMEYEVPPEGFYDF